ncbi:MAG: cytochrome ubiquinol oxidase subunit I, partial [candidate division KSB1 bacterium]|nr:cytochrome ubiquinol oxidase subunit I [candidate division KSB1 bacterium]
MSALTAARLQFATTTVYHFFFVPLTLGLSILVAAMETMYVKTGDEAYKRMTKFWGRLFLINFAMGVVTGIVQEFQFGMNWSEYSRFVGDIFGAPLAVEALLAFFLESTFLGIWVFGWKRLPKVQHAVVIWLVALGTNLSAFWILVANSFMHEPVGFVIRNGRAEMTDFWALVKNPHVWVQFPHVFFSALTTAAFFVIGISAYHLWKKSADASVWRRSMKIGIAAAVIGTVAVVLNGHTQAQHMTRVQPMKMAAAEALWEGQDPAPLSLFSLFDEKNRRDIFAVKIPRLLSLLALNRLSGRVEGVNDVQKRYEELYGPGNYVPPVAVCYWSFRIMVGAGLLMALVAAYLAFGWIRTDLNYPSKALRLLVWAIPLPYLANTTGWILTEVGRQPWTVFGIMRVEDAVSPTVSAGWVTFSLILFVVVYG